MSSPLKNNDSHQCIKVHIKAGWIRSFNMKSRLFILPALSKESESASLRAGADTAQPTEPDLPADVDVSAPRVSMPPPLADVDISAPRVTIPPQPAVLGKIQAHIAHIHEAELLTSNGLFGNRLIAKQMKVEFDKIFVAQGAMARERAFNEIAKGAVRELSEMGAGHSRTHGRQMAERFGTFLLAAYIHEVRGHACRLDLDDIVKLNALLPGSIFREPEIVEEMRRRSAIAVEGSTADERIEAVGWLQKACVPRLRKKNKLIGDLSLVSIAQYMLAYIDVIAIRKGLNTFDKSERTDIDEFITMVHRLFPCAKGVDRETLFTAGDYRSRRNRRRQFAPVVAAAEVMNGCVEISESKIRRIIRDARKDRLDWNESLRPQLEFIGNLVGTAAAVRAYPDRYPDGYEEELTIPAISACINGLDAVVRALIGSSGTLLSRMRDTQE